MSSRKELRLAREGEPRFHLAIPIEGPVFYTPTPEELRTVADLIRRHISPANAHMVRKDIMLYGTIDVIIDGIHDLADELEKSQSTQADT